jgi:hypothetical protein
MRQPQSSPAGRALRAGIVCALAVAGAVVTWRLRPATAPATDGPDADIVLACSWLAWALAGYLCVAVAATSLSRLTVGVGLAGQWLARLAPARLRAAVDAAITLGVAASIVGTAATGAVAAPRPHVVAMRTVAGSALDWPGLAATTAPTPPSPHRAAPPHPDAVVVQPGDTLWSIAARHLGPHASGTQITTAWHAWYAANRAVIGTNPSLIKPGQRLVAPASTD